MSQRLYGFPRNVAWQIDIKIIFQAILIISVEYGNVKNETNNFR